MLREALGEYYETFVERAVAIAQQRFGNVTYDENQETIFFDNGEVKGGVHLHTPARLFLNAIQAGNPDLLNDILSSFMEQVARSLEEHRDWNHVLSGDFQPEDWKRLRVLPLDVSDDEKQEFSFVIYETNIPNLYMRLAYDLGDRYLFIPREVLQNPNFAKKARDVALKNTRDLLAPIANLKKITQDIFAASDDNAASLIFFPELWKKFVRKSKALIIIPTRYTFALVNPTPNFIDTLDVPALWALLSHYEGPHPLSKSIYLFDRKTQSFEIAIRFTENALPIITPSFISHLRHIYTSATLS